MKKRDPTANRLAVQKHYRANKEYYYEKKDRRLKKIKEWYVGMKSTLVCSKCGENHPSCMEFHHLDPAEKDLHVSHGALHGWGIERIKREIEKCVVLCSNCHRKLHWEEGNVGKGV